MHPFLFGRLSCECYLLTLKHLHEVLCIKHEFREYVSKYSIRSALVCISFACQIFQSTSILYVYQFQLVASVCSSHDSITVRFS